MAAPTPRYVSRGGQKLEHAIATFDIEVNGRRTLDAGASTGGFTDCLLQHGVGSVVAVDVGYGQLDERLRVDPRVEVHDRTNVRLAVPSDLGGTFDLIVADLSFISLCTVAPALAALSADGADLVLLVKPQFEVGRRNVGKGGVVTDPDQQAQAVRRVAGCLEANGIGLRGMVESPIRGAKGNREFLLWGVRGAQSVTGWEVAP